MFKLVTLVHVILVAVSAKQGEWEMVGFLGPWLVFWLGLWLADEIKAGRS